MWILFIGVVVIILSIFLFKEEAVELATTALLIGSIIAGSGFYVGWLKINYSVSELLPLENGWYQVTVDFKRRSVTALLSPEEVEFYKKNLSGKITEYKFDSSYSVKVSETHYNRGRELNENKNKIETEAETGRETEIQN